ncbi:MAG: SAM-dependent methyltransferase [Oscillospiraceae bacterium]|nr:SAM-dependent methyltransferase [Oscillospiraceae bacterium]
MLSPRLLACADLVTPGGCVCDVGTDHAKLAVHLLTSGRAHSAIASDIGEGPLGSARKTIEANGLIGRIRTILSDGLTQVPPEGLTDIVIAGMGGETIIHILESCPWQEELRTMRLILQPMTRAALLREWLYENGFAIREERCVREGKFLYAVMAVTSDVPRRADAVLIWLGRMDLHDPDCLAYAQRQARFLQQTARARADAGTPDEVLTAAAAAVTKRLEEFT